MVQTAPQTILETIDETTHETLSANIDIIDQLKSFLERLEDSAYTQVTPLSHSPVGAHIRHIIEFYQEFLCVLDTPNDQTAVIHYDGRARNLTLETDRTAAIDAFATIVDRLSLIHHDKQVNVLAGCFVGAAPLPVASSINRELYHVMEHSIHHMAIIGMLARAAGAEVPKGFGLAIATQDYEQTQN